LAFILEIVDSIRVLFGFDSSMHFLSLRPMFGPHNLICLTGKRLFNGPHAFFSAPFVLNDGFLQHEEVHNLVSVDAMLKTGILPENSRVGLLLHRVNFIILLLQPVRLFNWYGKS
jgi:hypothetical protein